MNEQTKNFIKEYQVLIVMGIFMIAMASVAYFNPWGCQPPMDGSHWAF